MSSIYTARGLIGDFESRLSDLTMVSKRSRSKYGAVARHLLHYGAKKAIQVGGRYAVKKGISYLTGEGSKRGTQPLTTQHDYKTDYRARRKSRKERFRYKRGKRFQRKVRDAWMRIFTYPQSVSRVEQYDVSVIADASVQFQAVINTVDGLIPASAIGASHDDWRVLFREGGTIYQNAWDNALNTTTGPTNPSQPTVGVRGRSMMFLSCMGELTVRNTGAGQVIVNAYLVVCRKDVARNNGTESLLTLYTDGFKRSGAVSDDATLGTNPWNAQITSSDLSATPFMNALFCRHYKILKRTKFNLGPGQDFSLIIKSHKRRVVDMTTMIGRVSKKGFTYGYMFDCQGAPATGSTTDASTLAVQFLKRYHINLMPQRAIETAHLTDL